ncbi:MAG: hypothetical protein IJC56_11780 [Clostridia bacterium]|nr:hypothetical protein [Clostridia bacterium]
MENETRLEYFRLCDRMSELTSQLQLMRTLLTGMLEVYEHECLATLRFVPEEYSDIKGSFTAIASSLYFLSDKLDALCFPEST